MHNDCQHSQTTKKKRGCCKTTTKISLVVISGLFSIVIGAVCFSQADDWIQSFIDSKLVIAPRSPTYQQWVSPTVPVRMQFYMFNVENPLEMKQGGRPFVSQKGPYCYRVYQTRKNITWNMNFTVSYNKFTKYVFSSECSCPSCNPYKDLINFPNIPLVILSEVSKLYPGASFLFSIIFARFKEDFFKVLTINEILWGYTDPTFKFFAELRQKFHLSFLPAINPVFSLMENNTLDGIATTYTGESKINRAGVWTMWKGKSNVGLWNSSWANMLNGSDGMQFPPQTTREEKLYAFYVKLCRSMQLVYDSQRGVYSVDTMRFTHAAKLWQNTSVNPANAGFCPNGCFPTGILDASVCKDTPVKVPVIVASEPHFYQGDPTLVESVQGLRPNKEEHATFFDIAPHFGLPLHLSLRLQLNLNIKPAKNIPQMAGVKKVILPIMYFNNTVTIDASTAKTVKEVLIGFRAAKWVSAALMCIGGLELIVALGWLLARKRQIGKSVERSASQGEINDETKPLLSNGE
ncbi:lysosome membrane protein 2-like [Acropora millepora]|uniref:lysosome membrane protein 2-like n=1 Tax=Acropora millepora TaxID=45264 RepID=UPI0010FC757C|nr:lysosome membrane protein 2-like [Acropora millepora]